MVDLKALGIFLTYLLSFVSDAMCDIYVYRAFGPTCCRGYEVSGPLDVSLQ